MTNKKKKILTIVSIILLILIYFGYKGFNLLYYDINNMTIEDYNKIISGLKIKDTMTIKTTKLEEKDYLAYKKIKIRNDFKKFENKTTNPEVSATYVLKDEENNQTIAIIIGNETDTFVNMLKNDTTLFGTEDNRVTNTSLTKYLEKNKITNDIELFEFVSNQKPKKVNIFTPVKQMKENYKLHFITAVIFPIIKDITLINGDYNGYIFNIENNVGIKDVSIIKNDKRYTVTFLNTNYFTNDYINELLNTLIIE